MGARGETSPSHTVLRLHHDESRRVLRIVLHALGDDGEPVQPRTPMRPRSPPASSDRSGDTARTTRGTPSVVRQRARPPNADSSRAAPAVSCATHGCSVAAVREQRSGTARAPSDDCRRTACVASVVPGQPEQAVHDRHRQLGDRLDARRVMRQQHRRVLDLADRRVPHRDHREVRRASPQQRRASPQTSRAPIGGRRPAPFAARSPSRRTRPARPGTRRAAPRRLASPSCAHPQCRVRAALHQRVARDA